MKVLVMSNPFLRNTNQNAAQPQPSAVPNMVGARTLPPSGYSAPANVFNPQQRACAAPSLHGHSRPADVKYESKFRASTVFYLSASLGKCICWSLSTDEWTLSNSNDCI